jgi:Flp pilus assembly protein TadG
MRFLMKRFARDKRGSFGILIGVLLLPLTLSALMGVEYFRLVEFRDKLDSVATQVAMAATGGKQRSETQRLSEGRALLARVMEQNQINQIGNSGIVIVKVQGSDVSSTVKLEVQYKHEFGSLFNRQGTKLAVERTIANRKPKSNGSPPKGDFPPEGMILDDASGDLPETWSY